MQVAADRRAARMETFRVRREKRIQYRFLVGGPIRSQRDCDKRRTSTIHSEFAGNGKSGDRKCYGGRRHCACNAFETSPGSEISRLIIGNSQRQVLIEMTIVEVALSDDYQAGVDWTLLTDDAANGGNGLISTRVFSVRTCQHHRL